jgi:hypothetical protein
MNKTDIIMKTNDQGHSSFSRGGRNFYCGQGSETQKLYRCNNGCDGRCGPTNGCNCPSCGKLDKEYGIMDWHVRTYDMGDEVRNLEKQRLKEKKIEI